ncbi:DoxX family membrane protein [bacterium]|nr:DoxX family membrane protein [bacterium]
MQIKESQKLQTCALVILRILIGWHFLYEGVAKLLKGNWSAAGFLSQSKWILSPVFQWMVSNETVLNLVNQMNIWGLILIGLGLITGTFTRIAAAAGMALIFLYYLCNPPLAGLFYSIPSEGNYLIVNKNVVEMAALFVLIVFPAARNWGIDHILVRMFRRS